MSININNTDDENYRYKMPKVSIKFGGAGNGIFTIIDNMDEIGDALNTPPDIIYKYIAYTLGSAFNEKKKSFTGHHKNIQNIIFDYINFFVICPSCSIPELTYSLNKINSRNYDLISKCSSCGNSHILKSTNKINEKCMESIIKFMQKMNSWTSKKGNMVQQTTTDFILSSDQV